MDLHLCVSLWRVGSHKEVLACVPLLLPGKLPWSCAVVWTLSGLHQKCSHFIHRWVLGWHSIHNHTTFLLFVWSVIYCGPSILRQPLGSQGLHAEIVLERKIQWLHLHHEVLVSPFSTSALPFEALCQILYFYWWALKPWYGKGNWSSEWKYNEIPLFSCVYNIGTCSDGHIHVHVCLSVQFMTVCAAQFHALLWIITRLHASIQGPGSDSTVLWYMCVEDHVFVQEVHEYLGHWFRI